MESEKCIQESIRLELSKRGLKVLRLPCGLFYTKDGRPVGSGLPPGTSDLLALAPHGRAIFIEVKRPDGRLTAAQTAFIRQMRLQGFAAGVARSVDDALRLCGLDLAN
jgi:hypothetical protein